MITPRKPAYRALLDKLVYSFVAFNFAVLTYLYVLIWTSNESILKEHDLVLFDPIADYFFWLLLIFGNFVMYSKEPFATTYPGIGDGGKIIDSVVPLVFLPSLLYLFLKTIKQISG
jgi:hypothetical protein